MAKLLGVELAPLNVPLKRRLQTLLVVYYVSLFVVVPPLCLLAPAYLLFYTSYWWAVVLYGLWFLYDSKTPKRGSTPWPSFRQADCWRYFRDYFPVSLHKTVDLPPDRNYLFGYHPHGVMGAGAFANFATESTDFSGTFAGLTPHLLTLVGQFWFPLRREYLQLFGICDCSKESIEYLLNRPTKGHAVVLVVGGAVEALDARPGSFNLQLSRRKGFVRLALQHGAHLVPVFSFGENDLFEQTENPPGSTLRKVQTFMKDYLGFSPPLFRGRGIFNYTFGLLPFRRAIHTVVGRPISVVKNPNPTDDEIKTLHGKYVDGLVALFDENKTKYGVDKNAKLSIY